MSSGPRIALCVRAAAVGNYRDRAPAVASEMWIGIRFGLVFVSPFWVGVGVLCWWLT